MMTSKCYRPQNVELMIQTSKCCQLQILLFNVMCVNSQFHHKFVNFQIKYEYSSSALSNQIREYNFM